MPAVTCGTGCCWGCCSIPGSGSARPWACGTRTSTSAGCLVRVVARDNANGARAKGGRGRAVPASAPLMRLYADTCVPRSGGH